MCGIHGIVALRGDLRPDPKMLEKMGAVTEHRGPDDAGIYMDSGVHLGMRRLSIIDIAGGHQPIANEDGSVRVVCNGEIYNYRELRTELRAKGHTFTTDSDSEVLVHLYEEYGDNFASHLNGMFGFALWDVRRGRLLLGRDRLGIKPVYYLEDDRRLIFASEAKAILAVDGVEAELDTDVLPDYLLLGYVPAPQSMFRGIRKLPPASVLIVEDGRTEIHRYWQLSFTTDDSRTADDWAEELLSRMEKAVEAQMVSDVPLGAFLSGGIDSSSVVALMARHSAQPIKTYSIGFGGSSGGGYYNELPYAKEVAQQFGADHHEILVEPDAASLLPRLIWHLDEPMADAAFITTYLVSEFARRSVTVILSGVGGDELFGGYRRYLGEYYLQRYRLLPGWLRRSVIHPAAKWLPSDRHSPLLNLSRYARSFILSSEQPFAQRYRSYIGVFDNAQIERLLGDDAPIAGRALDAALAGAQGDELQRMLGVDIATQLPDDLLMLTDKMSMATSLECRVPLLDHELVEFAARMPSAEKIRGRELKSVMKRALSGVLPNRILYRSKRGFGAPMGAWLKRELAPVLKSVLSEQAVSRRGLFDWNAIDATMRAHEANRADHTDHLLSLLNLELWCRIYLDGQSPDDLAAQIGEECAA